MVAPFRSNLMVRDEHILVKKLHSHIAKDFLDGRRNVPRISWRLDEIVFAPRFKPVVIRRKHRGRAIDDHLEFHVISNSRARFCATKYVPFKNIY